MTSSSQHPDDEALPDAGAFAVACIAREPAALLTHFIQHYSDLGACEVFIVYDGPAQDDIAALRTLHTNARVIVEFRTADDWIAQLGDGHHVLRNRIGATFHTAKERVTAPWLFCTDADEFLIARTPVADMLRAVPDSVDSIVLPTVEAVWGPDEDIDAPFGSTWFRRPIWDEARWNLMRRAVYGRNADLFSRGLIAHQSGKHFIRTDRDYDDIQSHKSFRGGQSVTRRVDDVVTPTCGNEVAHFDAICFTRWRDKFSRRIKGQVDAGKRGIRQAQTQRIADALAQGDEQARTLFRTFYQLTPTQLALLRASRSVFRYPSVKRDVGFHPGVKRNASFAVSTIALEKPVVLARFINHYSDLGARDIHIHYDGPYDPDVAQLNGRCGSTEVHVRFYERDFWIDRLGNDYRTLRRKHDIVHRVAQEATSASWLLCTDIDEFIMGAADVDEMLEAAPLDVLSLRLGTVEAVWGPNENIDTPFGSTWFRRPIWKEDIWLKTHKRVYGEFADYLDHGLIGHRSGKYFVRTDADYDLFGSHTVEHDGAVVTKSAFSVLPAELRNDIAHFDAICFDRWREKLARRVLGATDAGKRDKRQAQQALFAKMQNDDRALRRLFKNFYKLSVYQIALLSQTRSVFRRRLFDG